MKQPIPDTQPPVVSICVQTYNHRAYIETCLESILSQKTDFPFEILLGEDNSTDGTREFCVEIAAKHPGLIKLSLLDREQNILVNGQPSGRYNVINNIRRASGKYIALCEGDDYWVDPEKLKTQVSLLENDISLSMTASGRIIVDTDNNHISDQNSVDGVWTTSDIVKGKIPYTQTMLFRNYTSLPDFLMQHKHEVGGDRFMSYFCSLHGNIHISKHITAAYRINPEGAWSWQSEDQKVLNGFDNLYRFQEILGIPDAKKYLASEIILTLAVKALRQPGSLFGQLSLLKKIRNNYNLENRIQFRFFTALLSLILRKLIHPFKRKET